MQLFGGCEGFALLQYVGCMLALLLCVDAGQAQGTDV
jgi:hypothetical protein